MNNFTDGKSDGLMLSYVKDGKVYPVLCVKEDMELLDAMIGGILTKVQPVLDVCMGEIEVAEYKSTEQRHAGIRTRKFIKGDNNK